MNIKKLNKKRNDRAGRVRYFLKSNSYKTNKLRISVFRSLNNIYLQLIDDLSQKTLLSFSTLKLKDKKNNKSESAKFVGLSFSKLVLEKGYKNLYFDRGRFLFHGRIKALVDGLIEGGLKI